MRRLSLACCAFTALAALAGRPAAVLAAADPAAAAPAAPAPQPTVVRFLAGDGVELAGLLHLPVAAPPHPAVLLLAGSRPTAKEDERLAAVAAAFVSGGFAVLATDSRGVGGSPGEHAGASFERLAEDAAAAVDWLRQRPEVRSAAVGLWGLSQGATWVGPLAAERTDAAFLIAVSGPLSSPAGFMEQFLAARLREQGALDEAAIGRVAEARRAMWRYYASGRGHEEAAAALAALRDEPWFAAAGLPAAPRAPAELAGLPAATRTFLAQKDLDPLAALGRLRCPVLVLYGAADRQLPVVAHAAALRDLASRGETRLTVELLAGLDHDLRPVAEDPLAGGVEPRRVMVEWAAAQVREPAGPRRQ